jgi:hypothetical protein
LGGKEVKADASFPVVRKTTAAIRPALREGLSAAQRNEQAILNFSLRYFAMRDSVREGDGDRVHVYCKVFFVMCERTHHTNYVVEHAQLFAMLPKSLAQEQKYNRFVNQRGGLGKTIPMNLMIEFWSKLAKGLYQAVGYQNLTPQRIKGIGASISTIYSINTNLYRALGIREGRGARDRHEPCVVEEVKIMGKLERSGFLTGKYPIYDESDSKVSNFSSLDPNPLGGVDKTHLKATISRQTRHLRAFQRTVLGRVHPLPMSRSGGRP